MEIIEHKLNGVIELIPSVFNDERGSFHESYNSELFRKIGINDVFVQDNQSSSEKNVLRGLHFQKPPFAQSKLVRVAKGKVLDVVVDLRSKSDTFLQYLAVELNDSKKNMLYIPQGFAHGFLTLEDDTIFTYKCGNFYNKDCEMGLLWNDEKINIDWSINRPILSEKDKNLPDSNKFISPF